MSYVSMKSGMEDRNNDRDRTEHELPGVVSMKSGLEDRNNTVDAWSRRRAKKGSQ